MTILNFTKMAILTMYYYILDKYRAYFLLVELYNLPLLYLKQILSKLPDFQ